jgi:uncharacterized membrane protein YidH (DUF202 family)
MRESAESDLVEFLGRVETARDDEELLFEPRRVLTGNRRGVLLVLAATALFALGTLAFIRMDQQTRPPLRPVATVRLPPVARVPAGPTRAARCPPRFRCTRSRHLPDSVRRVLRRYFPLLRIAADQNVVVTDGERTPFLWYRRLALTDGNRSIAICVEQPFFGRLFGRASEVGDRTSVAFVRTAVGTAAVTVQIVSPAQTASGLGLAARLARDRGLELVA